MNSAIVALGAIFLFFLGKKFYANWLATSLFQLEKETQPTPAVEYCDHIDYVPSDRSVLFGHHFSSIAGAAPIVGPAVAVIWGWLPAVIWIVAGVIFMGAVHDFGALVISMKHKGSSMAQVAQDVLGTRARNLLLFIIFFLVWMVIAVFALVIANLFISYPSSVLPVNFEIIIALIMGLLIRKQKISLKIPALLAQIGLFIMIYLGQYYPLTLEPLLGEYQLMGWIIFLLIYSMIASCLPVWMLLQPRDYINGHQLFLGLGLMCLGLFVTAPPIVAPAINPHPVGAPSLFPFLFITIACGAISGFHGLVSSGTTSKQVAKWSDTKTIGYGAMCGEGLLALLATLAVSTGFKTQHAWHSHFANWSSANGLSAKINAFVAGAGQFIAGLGIPLEFSQTVIAVLIISFAATSLDTACRIQRYVLHEFGESFQIPVLKNRYLASFLAVGSAFLLMLTKGGGKGGLFIWPLFGATNQMLAALTLIILTVYLKKGGRSIWAYAIPATLLVIITTIGLAMNTLQFYQSAQYLLFVIALFLMIGQIGMIVMAAQILKRSSS